MRNLVLMSCLVGAAVFVGIPAYAQQTADLAPPAPYGERITLEQAKKAVAGAEAEAKRLKLSLSVVIVEPSGELVYYQRADDVNYAAARVAQDKAVSAAIYRRATKAFQVRVKSGDLSPLSLRGAVPVEGGVPIVVNGKTIGAIGISGGSAVQDGQIAQAGADAVQ